MGHSGRLTLVQVKLALWYQYLYIFYRFSSNDRANTGEVSILSQSFIERLLPVTNYSSMLETS